MSQERLVLLETEKEIRTQTDKKAEQAPGNFHLLLTKE